MSTSHAHAFQPTRWTLVARATQDDAPAARAALDELCRIYWPPLFSFATRWGLSAADAEDATQNYFAELLRNDKFAIADADRGRLRTFLLHSFTKRLIYLRDRDHHRNNISFDQLETPLDPADPQAPSCPSTASGPSPQWKTPCPPPSIRVCAKRQGSFLHRLPAPARHRRRRQ